MSRQCSNFDSCRVGVNPQLILPNKQSDCNYNCDGRCPNAYGCIKFQPAFMDCGGNCSEGMVGRYTINKPVSFGGNYGTHPINDGLNLGNKTSCYGNQDLSFSGCFKSYL